MSHPAMSIECPNCDEAAVEVVADGGDPVFREDDRLTGTTADCSNCGDEFDVYFY